MARGHRRKIVSELLADAALAEAFRRENGWMRDALLTSDERRTKAPPLLAREVTWQRLVAAAMAHESKKVQALAMEANSAFRDEDMNEAVKTLNRLVHAANRYERRTSPAWHFPMVTGRSSEPCRPAARRATSSARRSSVAQSAGSARRPCLPWCRPCHP